jgi:hypothetical protein
MAKRNGPAESSSKSSTSVVVSLSIEDWNNVLASMEAGIKTIGFTAFEIGGRVMREISEQVKDGTA